MADNQCVFCGSYLCRCADSGANPVGSNEAADNVEKGVSGIRDRRIGGSNRVKK